MMEGNLEMAAKSNAGEEVSPMEIGAGSEGDSSEARSTVDGLTGVTERGFKPPEAEICLHGDDGGHDHLVQTILELRFQNEYFRTQMETFKVQHSRFHADQDRDENRGGESVELDEKVRVLTMQIHEQKELNRAAENALKHLRSACSEADAKVIELTAKLAEAQQKMEHEIAEREEKYTELDSKFGRLHKRAKQRIQELQKEKDDLEVNLRETNDKVTQMSSQQSSTQQEVERTRQKASEALRSLDAERQQLRATNNKLRDNLDELRHLLEAKETSLQGIQQSLHEKEQMLHDMQGVLQSTEEKHQSAIAELTSKSQKNLESLEAQLAEALADRTKAAETILSLQTLLAEKESQIAELDVASSGEVAQLGAALDTTKGELIHLKDEHEKERENWQNALQALKAKLEELESDLLHSQIESAKIRSESELRMAVLNQQLNAKDTELLAAKEEACAIEKEFSSYKVRAHALLQKKDAELSAAKETEIIEALEAAVKETERELNLATIERDRAVQALNDLQINHDNEIGERDSALNTAKKRISDTEANLNSVKSLYLSERESWEKKLQNVEDTWQMKCRNLEVQVNEVSEQRLQKELESLQLQYKQLKEEHDSFRDIAHKMVEMKDKEIAKLFEEKSNLERSLQSRKLAVNGTQHADLPKQESQISDVATAEQQILLLARQQAQREEQLAQSQRHILALQEEIEELEHENRLHSQQEAMLKAELRNMERMQKRDGVDMTYLKNVILKLLETGEVEVLLPVVSTLLQFSPEETKKCQATYSSADASFSPSSSSVDATASGSRSLFSRFAFS